MVMYGETLGRWGLVGVLLSLGCSGVSSPPERERNPGEPQTSDAEGGNTSEAPPNTEDTAAVSTADDNTANDTSFEVEPAPSDGGEHWALVRSEASDLPSVEEWTYDDAARLVEARVVYLRRDVEPYYAVDITNTYDGDRILSVHDREPEDLVDLTYEYELDSGRVVSYVESAAGETRDSRVYSYDSEGRLVGSHENHFGEEVVWRLERRLDGEPSQLFRNDELDCEYAWRHIWLGTTCYSDGTVSQVYTPDGAQRLGSLSFDGSEPVQYSYDEAGRLTGIRHTNAVSEYRYAPDGKLLESIGSGYRELREYDESGQVREVRWSNDSSVTTRTFTYERRSPDEVVQTEVSYYRTVVRTYARLPHAPTREPQLPSYWSIMRMEQPGVYMAPLDFSDVP